jgi:hypothetical protein
MSLLTTGAVRARAEKGVPYNFSAANVLTERMQKQASVVSHDIFLSHSFDDKVLILGVALTLEDLGYTVFLDWRDDPTLDRKNVNSATALKLRERMRNSKCLFFATTENTSTSKWMPWELGFKDGQSNRSAILPLKATRPDEYKGQEYLGIYPYITQQRSKDERERLWVRHSLTCYIVFEDWLDGKEPFER